MHSNNLLAEGLREAALKIADKIKQCGTMLITAHARPDGDAIGSVSGLEASLRLLGKKVDVALADDVPERFAFAYNGPNVLKGPAITCNHELILMLDCGDNERTGLNLSYDKSKTCLINIDHHSSNTSFGNLNLVDVGASSACELIASFIEFAALPINKQIATSLMLGLVTDSRSFQNENLRPSSHLAAAYLLENGADTAPIFNMLNGGKSEVDLRVMGFGMTNFKLHCNNRLASLVIKQTDLKPLGASTANIFASGVFNLCLGIKTVMASVVIFEREDGLSACEFRSRGGINVKDTAVLMGGGGHLAASGCSRNISIDNMAKEAVENMTKTVEAFFNGNV